MSSILRANTFENYPQAGHTSYKHEQVYNFILLVLPTVNRTAQWLFILHVNHLNKSIQWKYFNHYHASLFNLITRNMQFSSAACNSRGRNYRGDD